MNEAAATTTAQLPDARLDATAFKALVSACYGRMFAVAARLTGCDADGEDVVQDVLTRLWMQREILGGVKNREAYLLGMTRNAAIDFIRRRKPIVSIDAAASEAEAMSRSSDESLSLQRELVSEVMSTLGHLSENQRAVITLRDVEGRDMDEIAKITGLSAINVRVLLSRGRKTLRAIIEKKRRHNSPP